ncbi:hypothetical protein I3J27_19295 [Bradyrhizobium xenonodulans]|uniref:Uncharacterized protein n=1 Tax=Bradyrhizobium xenonodulans TaxID=2736875 RepID=A0ABY7MZN9_9BRAD|nr:hypothetical protein [Bradyrhizobium xenonodulans]WBL82465.1 hypothetical protein I3J27_19295 [Bradyrhizobium xenonodulans]
MSQMRLTASRQPHRIRDIRARPGRSSFSEPLRGSMTVRSLLIPLTLLASITAGSAATASPVDVARKWGLLGRWDVDCANTVKQGGRNNLIAYEAPREGKLLYRRNDDPQDNYEIVDAKLGAGGVIVLTIEMPANKQTRELGITKLDRTPYRCPGAGAAR